MDYYRKHGVDTRIVRIFNTYGPRMNQNDGRVVSNFIVQALQGKDITIYGDGSQTRSFCYVNDLLDGMMALMKKLSGGAETSNGDFADEEGSEEEHMHGEEGHSHEGEEPCNECGMMECDCEPSGGQQVVDEVESEDQMAYNVAEENAPDSGADNTNADVAGNAAANSALATADAGEDEEEGEVYSKPVSEDGDDEAEAETEVDDAEEVEESIYESYANSADDTFEADIDFMTKVISGGLNKQKSTGQTTIPVIAGQKNRMGADGLGSPMKESTDLLKDYLKLSGL